jgi:hypothetical protein
MQRNVARAGEGARATGSIGSAQRALAADRQALRKLVNAVRGHLSELGIIAARGLFGLAELVAIVRDRACLRQQKRP